MAKVRLWVDAAAGPGTGPGAGTGCDKDAPADTVTGEADKLSSNEARDEVKFSIPSPTGRRVTEVMIDRFCC